MGSISFLRLLCLALAFFFSASLSFPYNASSLNALSKRNSDLYDFWNSIPGPNKAMGNSALAFKIDPHEDGKWGITYLYGCTAIIITDDKYVVVGHLSQESGSCISISNRPAVQGWLDKLTEATDIYDPDTNTRAWIFVENSQTNSLGITMLKEHLNDWELNDDQITVRGYTGSSGTGEPDPDSPKGLAAVKWDHIPVVGRGKLSVYFDQEDAIQENWY